ncbi:hypothetical protein PS880_01237 [Pseudomonas fluorescens]|uniref:Uncharacterized protein n=1 Tax=Pseudomonas fluorescens TaxID=294 RepID=A0A5E7HYX8_PSEFL|nr:hypothetical protein PS880_01237 [Pseudomonas fluorescens]
MGLRDSDPGLHALVAIYRQIAPTTVYVTVDTKDNVLSYTMGSVNR